MSGGRRNALNPASARRCKVIIGIVEGLGASPAAAPNQANEHGQATQEHKSAPEDDGCDPGVILPRRPGLRAAVEEVRGAEGAKGVIIIMPWHSSRLTNALLK